MCGCTAGGMLQPRVCLHLSKIRKIDNTTTTVHTKSSPLDTMLFPVANALAVARSLKDCLGSMATARGIGAILATGFLY